MRGRDGGQTKGDGVRDSNSDQGGIREAWQQRDWIGKEGKDARR